MATKTALLSTKTKVRFLNDVCLSSLCELFGKMMTASPNDVRCANDVCLTAHLANIVSLRNAVEQHHICEANASYRRGGGAIKVLTRDIL